MPGTLRLRLVGFGQQELVTTQEIAEAIDLLPRFHLEGLREICFEPVSPQEVAIYPAGQKVIRIRHAKFMQNQRRIMLYQSDNLSLFWRVLFHEIGHYVFFLIIGNQAKKRWVTEIHPHHFCVSEYATQDAQEDFAESYAAYVLSPHQLRGIPAKFAFMRDEVFVSSMVTLEGSQQNRPDFPRHFRAG